MLVFIPYPDGKRFNSFFETSRDEIQALRKPILQEVARLCSGPWSSELSDCLHNCVRVRVGSERDYFALKLKYGDI